MTVRFAVLCDYSNETNDGKLNLMGLTEAVFAHEYPAVHKQCHLIVSYQADAADVGQTVETKVSLIDADGRKVIEIQGTIQVPERANALNHRHILHDLQLPKPGPYRFVVELEGREVYHRSLEAVLIDRPA